MKGVNLLIFVVLLLVAVPFVSSADISLGLNRDSYSSGESVWVEVQSMVKLSKDLSADDFSLLRGSEALSITKSLIKISNSTYFFYFEMPNLADGTYSIKLAGVSYIINNKLTKNTFSKEIIVKNRDSVVNVWPPVLFGDFMEQNSPKFQIECKNKGKNTTSVTLSENNGLVSSLVPFDFSIIPNSFRWVDVWTNITNYSKSIHTTYLLVTYDGATYSYPIILKKKWYTGDFYWSDYGAKTNISAEINQSNVTTVLGNETNKTAAYKYPSDSLRFIIPTVPVSFGTTITSGPVGADWILKNFAEQPLNDLVVSFTGLLGEIVSSKFTSNHSLVMPGQEVGLNVVVYPNRSTKSDYNGSLVVSAKEGINASVQFYVGFSQAKTQNITTNKTVEEVNQSKIFNYSGQTQKKTLSADNSSGAWILIISVVILVAIAVLFSYLKSKPKKEKFGEYVESLKR